MDVADVEVIIAFVDQSMATILDKMFYDHNRTQY